MIELFASRHPFIFGWSCCIAGIVAAIPVAWAGWYYVILPGLVEEMKVREQMAEGKRLVRLMAADTSKRRCMDAMMIRGQLVCLEQGGR